jgi:coenzyme F420-reducing hydrogenase beta subunit
MIDFDFVNKCYSCGTCKSVCPKKCISYTNNEEGFLNPVVNIEECINCRLCEKNCPALSDDLERIPDRKKFFGVIRNDYTEYHNYTSAGVFYSLAKEFTASGGYVCGCILNEHMEAQHHCTNDYDIVKKMSKSKYVQSNMSFLYDEIAQIHFDKKILFSGTACQIEFARQVLKTRNVFYFEIICHGCPSPKVYEKYIRYIEKSNNKKIVDMTFRYKGKYGWITPMVDFEFNDGSNLQRLAFTEDPYIVGFGNDLYHKRVCYECKYKGKDFIGDITVGDFWGCDFEKLKISKNRGISEVAINSERGEFLLEVIKKDNVIFESDLNSVIRENKAILNPPHRNEQREVFLEELNKCVEGEFPIQFMQLENLRLKSVLNKIGVFHLIKMIRYRRTHK